MVVACPRCSRTLTDTAGEAAFCMYCGQRLHDTDASPPPQSAGSDADAGATQAFTPGDTSQEQPAEPQLTQVGGYRLVRFLGAGGMGQVYEAVAEDTGQRVAVKLLSGRLARNPQSVERFRQEGRVASQISHPNCVFVLRADADAGRPYLVMELMPGRTLKDVVDDRGPLPAAEAVARTLDVVDGLAEAHRLGVIHRDVKPSNCFVTDDDRVKVGDFGLSKSLAADADGQITGSGTFLGTVLYASPEQIRGEPVGYESDVYAVCGTLYYLLAGRAPYQHDSLTAALAKAVSEPAPSVRARRPDVPRELDRIIRRGLDRDRANRFASLDDLGDALRALQPERAVPARRRLMVLAYLLDTLFLNLLVLPLELARYAVFHRPTEDLNLFETTWLGLLVTAAYFVSFEGLVGTTPGKNLLRLRVRRLDRDGPTGVKTAALRTAVINLVWLGMTTFPAVFVEELPAAVGWPLALLSTAGCLAAMLRQLWKSPGGWRGVHDFAAGTRTVQRPRPAERMKLRTQYPDPFDRADRRDALPAAVGGFAVTGKLTDLPDGGEVWAAEDKGLGRRLVVRVCPPGHDEPDDADDAPRPFRLRAVGHGRVAWAGGERGWEAFAAPAGSPLADLAAPTRPVNWTDARPVLEQVAEVATDDPAVRLDQVWVEPTGRVQVAEFPLPTGSRRTGSGDAHPLRLVRESATALLEGAPRSAGARVRAPLPPHATALLAGLFDPAGDLTAVRAGLADTRALPPQVTAGMRATQLGVQALLLTFGLIILFACGTVYRLGLAIEAVGNAVTTRAVRDALADPARREALVASAQTSAAQETSFLPLSADERASIASRLARSTAPGRLDDTLARLGAFADRQDARAAAERGWLNRPERKALDWLERLALNPRQVAYADSPMGANAVLKQTERDDPADTRPDRKGLFGQCLVGLLVVPLGWAAFAVLFRGGLAMRLGGLVPVRADGRPASRLWCGVRELLVWAPVVALLLGSLWVQAVAPGWVTLRTGLWLLAVLLLPMYVLVALRDPARPPHDRLLGTWLVPA